MRELKSTCPALQAEVGRNFADPSIHETSLGEKSSTSSAGIITALGPYHVLVMSETITGHLSSLTERDKA